MMDRTETTSHSLMTDYAVRMKNSHDRKLVNKSTTQHPSSICHVSLQLYSLSKASRTKHDPWRCPCLCVLSAADSVTEPTVPRPGKVCNESRLQWEIEVCGEDFKRDMAHIDPQHWCNITHFIRYEQRGGGTGRCRRRLIVSVHGVYE